MSTEFVDGTAGRIAVHHLGGSGERTLVVCHASGFLGRVYRALAEELADIVDVVALDFRGHGDSDTPETVEEFSWLSMTNDLQAVLEHLNRDELHGFGHSLGGAVLAEAERQAPGTFMSMFLFEPVITPEDVHLSHSPMVRAARARMATFPSRALALQRYASRPPLGLFRADVLHDYVTHGFTETNDGQATLKCLPESEANTFANAGEIHLGLLREIELDVVVGRSGDDGLPTQLAGPIADSLANGRLQEFANITHFGPLQDPVVVANALRELVVSSSPTL